MLKQTCKQNSKLGPGQEFKCFIFFLRQAA